MAPESAVLSQSSAAPVVRLHPADVYWLTRDTVEGALADRVEVWLARPTRLRFLDGDTMWIAPLDAVDREATYWGEWSLDQARSVVGPGAPDNDRECTKIG